MSRFDKLKIIKWLRLTATIFSDLSAVKVVSTPEIKYSQQKVLDMRSTVCQLVRVIDVCKEVPNRSIVRDHISFPMNFILISRLCEDVNLGKQRYSFITIIVILSICADYLRSHVNLYRGVIAGVYYRVQPSEDSLCSPSIAIYPRD